MKKYRLGLIGCGTWGQNYIKTIDGMPNVELSALCRQQNIRPDFLPSACKLHTNPKDFYKDDLDGVIVANPTPFNIVQDLLFLNIPVLSEKPLLTSQDQIDIFLRMTTKQKLLVLPKIPLDCWP